MDAAARRRRRGADIDIPRRRGVGVEADRRAGIELAQDEAIGRLKQAVAIYAEIGVEAGSIQPEIWKLVEW